MKRTLQLALAITLTAAFLLGVGSVAMAADIEGKVKSVDVTGRVVTLEDGTTLTLGPGAKWDPAVIHPGSEVKASYEEKGGKKMATSIELRTAQPAGVPPQVQPGTKK
jgi:hypothetical protein